LAGRRTRSTLGRYCHQMLSPVTKNDDQETASKVRLSQKSFKCVKSPSPIIWRSGSHKYGVLWLRMPPKESPWAFTQPIISMHYNSYYKTLKPKKPKIWSSD
jgi:hypothetical protein